MKRKIWYHRRKWTQRGYIERRESKLRQPCQRTTTLCHIADAHTSDLPDIPRIAPIGRIQENEPRKPEVPHLRIAEKRNDEDLWPSNFSDAPSTNYNISARAEEYNQHNLPPLQFTNENEVQARGLAPLAEDVVDPEGFDLAPAPRDSEEGRPDLFSLERRSLLMFSKTHLRVVFEDLKLLRKFSAFLVEHRPDSVPLLVYHLEARKALAAIKYTNAITRKMKPLGSLGFTHDFAPKTSNEVLIQKAEASFEVLANQDLPAWITSVWMKAVEASIRRRINGTLPSQLREYVCTTKNTRIDLTQFEYEAHYMLTFSEF